MPTKRTVAWTAVVAAVACGLVLAGPRAAASAPIRAASVPPDIDAFLSASEGGVSGLVAGVEKGVVWNGRPGRVTDLAPVYLHGFTASRREMSPALESAAQRLGANLFFNRYAGHGCGPDAMAEATLQLWVDDTVEAIAIGHRIGRRVAVVATSTAAPLLCWVCTRTSDVDAIVLVAPNFGPRDARAELPLPPWANLLVRALEGEYREWGAANELQARYATRRFKSAALITMTSAVALGRRARVGSIAVPVLVAFSGRDDVVSLEKVRQVFGRIGSEKKAMVEFDSAAGHVVAGDISSPASTPEFVQTLVSFIEGALE